MRKIIFIHNNYEPERIPTEPDLEDRFYTYGFGSYFARSYKEYFPIRKVEMWKLDSYTKNYYEKTVQGVKFKVFNAKKIFKFGDYSRRFIKELRKEISANDPVLFVSHTHTWLLYQIAYFFPDCKIVTSHHGDWSPFFRIHQRKGLRKLKDWIDTKIEKKVLKNVDYFLVCDFYQIPYIKKAAPNSKINIFSTGLDINKIKPVEKKTARQILGWDQKKKYILYLGKLYRYKQPVELIKIWKEIKNNKPEVELVIIGNSEEDEFYKYAVNSGAMVLGRVLNKDLNTYYSAADVYVLISLRDDYFGGIGIAPLESLACNTPVVSNALRNYVGTNIKDIGEIPTSLDEYKHAIIKVLSNSGGYKNMRESVIKNYSHEAIAHKMETVFAELNNQN